MISGVPLKPRKPNIVCTAMICAPTTKLVLVKGTIWIGHMIERGRVTERGHAIEKDREIGKETRSDMTVEKGAAVKSERGIGSALSCVPVACIVLSLPALA